MVIYAVGAITMVAKCASIGKATVANSQTTAPNVIMAVNSYLGDGSMQSANDTCASMARRKSHSI